MKSENIVKRSAAELRAMEKRGETRWKGAAKKPLPASRSPDDAIEQVDWVTTKLPSDARTT